MKNFLVFFLLLVTGTTFAQLQSPGQFLGYKPGDRYTTWVNVVNYCRHVAEAAPNMVKLEQFGITNERRPLMLLYIASPENLARLETIRMNNLRLAGMQNDKTAAGENNPAIVWLS